MRVIFYDDAPVVDLPIVDYFKDVIAGINFFDNYREGNGVFYDETDDPF